MTGNSVRYNHAKNGQVAASKPKENHVSQAKFNNNKNKNKNHVAPTSGDKNKSKSVADPHNKTLLNEERRRLCIYGAREHLVEVIDAHDTLILLSETGSGKTTQIPQYIYDAKLHCTGRIGITQPRRVAAITVAMRVAAERTGNKLSVGELVGYSVPFEDTTSPSTKIKYLTDEILLRESMTDKLLMQYNVLVLDDVHERTIYIDVLFGIVKRAQRIRKQKFLIPLKIIVMSATMDVDHLSNYFNNSKVVCIEGRQYPVEVFYATKPRDDYQNACVATFFQIHKNAPANEDVLIFLSCQEEIETVAHQIRLLARDQDIDDPLVRVCTLYASQTTQQQMLVFNTTPENTRKVIISTNIAETSVTISGIKYIIDSGMVKQRSLHPTTGLEVMKVQRISKEQAWQRTGRAGRESEGICYRLYTRAQFDAMQQSSIPEIQRADLKSICLQLLALNVNAKNFDFLDHPREETLNAAFDYLKMLGAVENIDSNHLTDLGKGMAKFPLDPVNSKILIGSQKFKCMQEILTIISLMNVESVFATPLSQKEEAESVRRKFYSEHGDHLTLLNIYKEFTHVAQAEKKNWCRDHFINMRNLMQAQEICKQLEEICVKNGMKMTSCNGQTNPIRKCLLSGLFMNVAELNEDKKYITLDKKQVMSIHLSSILHGQLPQFVLFNTVEETSKCYLRMLTTFENDWLLDLAPKY